LNLLTKNYGSFRGLVRSGIDQTAYELGMLDEFVDSSLDFSKQRLVFVCWGNINRSAFAHASALKYGLNAASFGLSTSDGQSAFPRAISIAQEFSVDLSQHRTTRGDSFKFTSDDVVLAVEARHARSMRDSKLIPKGTKIILLGQYATPYRIHLHDPHPFGDDYFRANFTLIDSAIRTLSRLSKRKT
jgi:protein-tyrosine phosphatase